MIGVGDECGDGYESDGDGMVDVVVVVAVVVVVVVLSIMVMAWWIQMCIYILY